MGSDRRESSIFKRVVVIHRIAEFLPLLVHFPFLIVLRSTPQTNTKKPATGVPTSILGATKKEDHTDTNDHSRGARVQDLADKGIREPH